MWKFKQITLFYIKNIFVITNTYGNWSNMKTYNLADNKIYIGL